MRRGFGVGVVLLLATGPCGALQAQQDAGGRGKPRIEQWQAVPYSAAFRIPFVLDEEDFEEGRPVIVSIRIRNLLGQVVAVPTAVGHPEGPVAVDELAYTTPGYKEAYWHGLDRQGHRAAAGVYLLELVVNGERAPPLRIVVGS